ncbi:hypothetical protein NLG97_g9440 [Lecanicillium saksenae]|uniref:Uncharacterized protein n=1 Tax=Lecanicillium saksenae TaxID=468837 RepID=A0ACC1QIR9_9HYPO|nr:hypothetical protein NLG97_g9440 [Lecanicillium saksenae]
MAPRTTSNPLAPLRQTTLNPTLFKKKGASSTSASTSSAKKPRRAATVDASDRVQSDVLMAIQPAHLQNIASRKKNHEYRKYRLQDGVERLWFYETKGTRHEPGQAAITHIAIIPSNERRTPGTVPEEPHGIGNADFNAGLKKSKYGYPVLQLYRLVKPVKLEEMKSSWGLSAPMGWSYVRKNLWEDRWGEEKGREERVKRVF